MQCYFQAAKKNCGGNYLNPSNEECAQDLQEVNKVRDYISILRRIKEGPSGMLGKGDGKIFSLGNYVCPFEIEFLVGYMGGPQFYPLSPLGTLSNTTDHK